ncbi:phage major capsid protein [Tenggerimyces flavus]|uniref:Phage major capsid protein n=2 Tax=Tenggerimyces flavus TaxID=1708749 RepID=A0ABV7YPH6_9ACTN
MDQILAAKAEQEDELKTLRAQLAEAGTKGHAERADNLKRAIARRELAIGMLDEEAKVRAMIDGGRTGGESGAEPGAKDGLAPAVTGVLEQAKRRLDAEFKGAKLPDHAAAKAASLLGQGTTAEQTLAARWVTAAGDPEYAKAFGKLLVDPARGHLTWTPREADAYRTAKAVQAEMKAGSLTGNSELLPLNLDPTIRLTSAGSINPLRRIAGVFTTISNTWQGVTSAGVTAEWKGEGAQMTDAAPGTDPAPIPVHLGDAWVPFSYEVGQDAAPAGFSNAIADLLMDAADQLQNTAYTTGTGTGQPTGIITSLVAGAASVVVGTEAFPNADVYATQNALPPRFQANAQWCANLAIINLMSQKETTAGARLFPEISDGRLLNRPLNELSNMDGVINAAAENYTLLYGDFQRGFAIVDRAGTSVELVQNVVGVDGRPTGQRGVVMWFRTGSNVVVQNAFRLLNAT